MSSNRTLPTTFLLFLAGLVLVTPASRADACKDALAADDEALVAACTEAAVNRPYQLAWMFLAKLCGLASGAGGEDAAECEWQSWASFADTYPEDPSWHLPEWPADAGRYPPEDLKDCSIGDKKRYGRYSSPDPCAAILDFRLDKSAFDYIFKHDLWYQEGLKSAWDEGLEIRFPASAVALQAGWKEIGESDKEKYHWVTLEDETSSKTVVCGLVGLDVKSRILPNWFWMAFEHVDNVKRCDVVGCRDDFGQKPHYIPPAAEPGKAYPKGELTAELLELVPLSERSVWRNYRLKGVQTAFTDSDGKPTFLGNSAPQLEGEFLPKAMSCITCHSRSSFDYKGNPLPGLPVVHGSPKPRWFYEYSDRFLSPQLRYKQSNFIWSIPKDACPKSSPTEP